MWWSERRRLLLGLMALPLAAGCDFAPVYGTGGSAEALAGRVVVVPPDGSPAFDMARHLENRLGPPAVAAYELGFALDIDRERIAITATQDTNRFNLVGAADWALTDAASGAVLRSGRVDSFVSYAATGTTVATRTAERDAIRRLTRILADRIVDDLLAGPPA